MKVEDYIRTNNGDIGIIINCPEELKKDYGNWLWFETTDEQRPIRNEDIKLTSPNIIDLIEVGDFITYKKGNMYIDIPYRVYGTYNEILEETELRIDDEYLKDIEILSIVTREQFSQMEYKVKE